MRKFDFRIIVLIGLVLGLLVVGGLLFFLLRDPSEKKPSDPQQTTAQDATGGETEEATSATTSADILEVIEKARVMAAMYDYDGAIAYVKEKVPNYEKDTEASASIALWESDKSALVKWPDNTQITHIFFHSLIENNEEAFGSAKGPEYNQVMTTIDEFNKIMQAMYDKGYVLVRLSDIASINPETGHMQYNDIMLPAGKIPFVLSEDDVSYYEYMEASGGFPNRLIVAEDGKVMNEKDNKDGTKSVGAYDVVPLLDQFVEAHPGFSYHGAKGIIALTGYNGVLGYRTSYIDYAPEDVMQTVWADLTTGEGFDSEYAGNLVRKCHAWDNVNILADREKAKVVAQALREDGWDFASHTWGHMRMGDVVDQNTGGIVSQRLCADTNWWKTEVETIVGDTDIIIFAFGSDIHTWKPYTSDQQAFTYLKSQGFDYFCNVDSTQYFVQMSPDAGGSGFLRQGRRNLDGTMMFKAILYPEKNLVSDLFDASKVWDMDRPVPVLGVETPDGFDPATFNK